MDSIHNFRAKKLVPCKGLVILPLKSVNVFSPCHHRLSEGSFHTQVIPGHPHKVLCDVKDILVRGNHVDSLAQEISSLFLLESVLYHIKQNLHSHGALLSIFLAC